MAEPKASNKQKGLGDTVEAVTKATGIKKAVKLFTKDGEDCGCEKRKNILNTMFPYSKPNCMTKEQYDTWKAFKGRKDQNKVSANEQDMIIKMLLDVMNISVTGCSNCSGTIWKGWIGKIDKIYNTYNSK